MGALGSEEQAVMHTIGRTDLDPRRRRGAPLFATGAIWLFGALSCVVLFACSKASEKAGSAQAPASTEVRQDEVAEEAPAAEGAVAPAPGGAIGGKPRKRMSASLAEDKEKGGAAVGGPAEQAAETRSWFPETFLFEPLVVTGKDGKAELSVRVPDRLTSWRVLALAHSRRGSQAGTVTSFLGTLPVYVEPVVPPRLRAGDSVRLPINVVNTSERPVTAALTVSAAGATVKSGGTQRVVLSAGASAVRYVELRASRPGDARVMARLGSADAVVRKIAIVARGRPVTQTFSGTLAAPRVLSIHRASGSDPSLGQVRLQVFPGALALLRAELTAASSRSRSLADDAFALLLAARAPPLLRALGDKIAKNDKKRLRDLTILATQRALRRSRVLDTASAALLAEAALAHEGNPVLHRLGTRAVKQIAAKQAPDGTCGGETGWTLQRLLVATADCVRAASEKRDVLVRASGAFERNGKRIDDPYTAAAVLASGAASDGLAKRLRQRVIGAIKKSDDGSKALAVPKGVVRTDGERPSEAEAAALAVLALGDDGKKSLLADLGATVLAGYSPARGWGDGRANLVCMRAVLELFREPIPDNIQITLQRAGKTVAERALARSHVRDVLVLQAAAGDPGSDDEQRWRIAAKPAVPGLGFSLALTDRVPWNEKRAAKGGVELSVVPPKAAAVGKPATLAVRAVAPSGKPLRVELELPAGVQLDRAQLDKLVRDERLAGYRLTDESLQLRAAALEPGKLLALALRVIPTLAGTVHSGPSSLRVATATIWDPPSSWTIGR